MVYTAPGVYVVEDDRTPMPLTGVPTGIPCFFGFTQQGPYLKPTRISSLTEFNAIFGPRVVNKAVFPASQLADALYGFFLNGGSICYICRVNGGDTVAWPVSTIQHVVDYADLKDQYSPHTPANPKFLGLSIFAASPGAWANQLVVKCSAEAQGDSLPLVDAPLALLAADIPKAAATVPYARLATAGTAPLPALGNLNANCTLDFGKGIKGPWDPKTSAFTITGRVPTAATTGTLSVAIGDGPTARVVTLPVSFTPDGAFVPAPALKVGEQKAALTPEQAALWNGATRVRFAQVEIIGDDGATTKTDLVGVWSVTDQALFFSTADGDPVVLDNSTVKGDLTKGTLTYPLALNAGDSLTFTLEIKEPVPPKQPGGAVTYRVLESYAGLSTVPGEARYFLNDGLVNGVSSRVRLAPFDATAGQAVAFGDDVVSGAQMVGSTAVGVKSPNPGTDAAPAPSDYLKYFPLLKQVDDVSLIACPDVYPQGPTTPAYAYQPILQALVDYCENNKCMAVIDPPPQAPALELGDLGKRVENLERFVASYRSSYAAVYAPWLAVPNTDASDPNRTKLVPPSGHILGLYNKSDGAEGVWSSPANMPVKGALGLGLPFTEVESAVLNPKGVNLIRSFPGQGVLVWGARTTSPAVMWQYVNVRRIFLYVERTLQQQTMWAVFEPNTRRTWNTLVNAAENFLRQLWLDGGLAGDTPEKAFRVQCGMPETMTQTDVDTGVLKVQIAIAPVKPAEFVVFTISQLVQTAS